ncbi:tRNA synthetase class II [Ordospora pajunii]|uniref:tRNA synthetase class II n=1 Tax=Ordospora pajunii TaxID=3039483 RepID=UPI002952781D|nr:tRNA synthetase class II [Ordospora pajunii]KAH9411639.1 tRNA synthetase class II [Ordospora pajunii]
MASHEDRGMELSEEEFYVQRSSAVKAELAGGNEMYPHKFEVSHCFREILDMAGKESTPFVGGEVVRSAGRIMNIRMHSRFCFFYVVSGGEAIQLVVNIKEQDAKRSSAVRFAKRGDVVGFVGNPGRTKTLEQSVFVCDLDVVAPCMRTIPTEHFGLRDAETIYRKRHLDLLINKESRERFETRARIVKYVRAFLDFRGFMEVETPMMNLIPGGAAAKPFITHHNELKLDLYMRVSPELYLKKLVIGGFDRVYEMGKQFRNEGIDLTHNPEFSSCEFYMAYADYNDIMDMTEEMLSGLVHELFASEVVRYEPKKRGEEAKPVEISFSRPFRRISILEELNAKLGLELTGENLEDEKTLEKLMDVCAKENVAVEKPHTLARVLDKLIGHVIEPQCVSPTFIKDYPVVMSPLAKRHRSKVGLTERFELFINSKEICNAYTELNNPFEQRERFEQQANDQNAGDEEAMMLDEDFCTALEYGLPPTGGWGLGVDRLVMYLTNAANIKDVIFFPAMKPE